MSLEVLYNSLTPDERMLQFGIETDEPLSKAFPRKRMVHAGLNGSVIGPKEAQKVWNDIMAVPPNSKKTQMAYVHIPFCKTKCLYCGFFQNGTDQSVEDRYVNSLIDELEASADLPRLRDGLIHAVFIGGGTPTSLSAQNAKRLLQTLQNCLPLANDYELTLEGRIHDLIPEKMDVWLSNGVNRMSLGVQSFNTKVRQQVGRLDDQETVLERLALLKSYEQAAIVIDLIYGLPDQDMTVWERDLELLVQSGVDGADLYQLNVFDGSDLNAQIQRGNLSPAAESEYQGQMFSFAKDYLDRRGYQRLNICHWRSNNRERSLYNTLARNGVALFPFGSGAGGSVDGYSTMLHRALQPYEMLVQDGKKPFMALMKQSPLQSIADNIQKQIGQGYFDIKQVTSLDSRLQELTWLYDFWEKRELVKHNGFMYMLTDAGQFWHVNLTQTTLECVQYLLTGKNSIALEGVAAQDSVKNEAMMQAMKKMKEMKGAPGVEAMKRMAEAMQQMDDDDIKEMMKQMQGAHKS